MGTEVSAPKEFQSRPELKVDQPNWDKSIFDAPSSSHSGSGSRFETETTATDAGKALQKGDMDGLNKSIESAFESAGGNPAAFKQFGEKFKEEMQGKGYDVKVGENSLDMRKQGSEKGVRIGVNGELDFWTGKVTGEASSQTIDWATGKPVEGNPEEVLGKKSERSELFAPIKFNRDAPDEGGGKFKPIDKFEKRFDPSESLKGVSSALESNNIEGVQDSIKQAFEASKGNPADFENQVPIFLEIGEPCEYYQLSEQSPGVDGGVVWYGLPNDDACGNMRIQGSLDVGAIETIIVDATEERDFQELDFMPNPATDLLTIEWPESRSQPSGVLFFSLGGQLLQQAPWIDGQPFDVHALPSGVYVVKVVADDAIFTGKLIKQ